MSRNENTVFVLSQYHIDKDHAGYSCLYDLHLQFIEAGARIIELEEIYGKTDKSLKAFIGTKLSRAYKIDLDPDDIPSGSHLIVLAYTPRFLLALKQLNSQFPHFEKIAVYFLDGFDSVNLDGVDRSIMDNIDYVFCAVEEMVEDFKNMGKKESYFVPFGIDALKYAPLEFEKTIDLLSFGRSNMRYHRDFEQAFNAPESPFSYLHSTFDTSKLTSQYEHRRLHWKTLLRSKIALCFEPEGIERFCGRSPVLYRWFECIAAGNLIYGTRPKCEAVETILAWENSTIEVPKNTSDAVDHIQELLSDTQTLESISKTNRYWAMKLHDWRYRLRDIYELMQTSMPAELARGLDATNAAQEKLFSEID